MVVEAEHSRRLFLILRGGSCSFQSFQVFGGSLSLRHLLSLLIFVDLLLQILNLDGHLTVVLLQTINNRKQLLDMIIFEAKLLVEAICDINDVVILSVKGVEFLVIISDDPSQVVESLLLISVGLLKLVDLLLQL